MYTVMVSFNIIMGQMTKLSHKKTILYIIDQ